MGAVINAIIVDGLAVVHNINVSIIKEFLEVTSTAEAPDSYFYWSSLAVISGTVSDRVYLNKGGLYKLYPNIFIFLISKGSGLGKGIPVSYTEKTLTSCGTTRLIIGQSSIEGIESELSRAYTTSSGRIINTAEATLLAGEFGSYLLANPRLFTDLTDLYDSQYHQGEWKKRLATKDTSTLKNICLTGLFAANEVHFRDAVPTNAMKGGFVGRTILVYESKRRLLNSLIGNGVLKDISITEIVSNLKELSKLKGEFKITVDAAKLYNEWYYDFYKLDKELKDDTGTAERLRDNILKVAMLESLSDDFNLTIEKEHIERGLIRCFQVYSSTIRLVIGEGKSSSTNQTKAVLKIIFECGVQGEISRKNLLIKGLQSGDFDYIELDRVLEHLFQVKIISQIENKGRDTIYKINLGAVNALLEREKRGGKND